MEMTARREGSFPVLSHIHRAANRVSFGDAFEYVADTGSFVMMAAAAAHLRALDFPPDVCGEEFAAMAAHQLVSGLLEEKGVRGVISRVGDLDVPLAVDLDSQCGGYRYLPALWRIGQHVADSRR